MGLLRQTLSMSIYQDQELRQEQDYSEKIENIPLFSLHRIKNQINDLGVQTYFKNVLILNFLQQNAKYQKVTGSKKLCLTQKHIDNALRITSQGTILKVEATQRAKKQRGCFCFSAIEILSVRKQIATDEDRVKIWLSRNFNNLLYNMNSELPLSVISELRERFRCWANKINSDAFKQSLNDVLLELGKKNKIHSNNPETILEKLKEPL